MKKIKNLKVKLAYYKKGYHSINRGIDFDLSLKEYTDLYHTKECSFCGGNVEHIKPTKGSAYRNWTIERINPEEGYTKDNVVVSCSLCNSIRNVIYLTYQRNGRKPLSAKEINKIAKSFNKQ